MSKALKIKKVSKKDILIFIIGLVLCTYPIISNFIEYHDQSKVISTYENKMSRITEEEMQQIMQEAIQWNQDLYLAQKGIKSYDSLKYEETLNISKGVMGSLEIPNIDVNLPIYHGTSDEILSVGVGHLSDTSLPVGGKNTHCVLTGHRGLPSSKLFTRLDELENGDLFYIYVCNEIHAYKIDDIKVVDPEEITGFEIEDGQDKVSLVTCTPYGINTQRLIVTGHRIKYVAKKKEMIKEKIPSLREIVFIMIPVVFLFFVIIYFLKRRMINE